MHPRNASSTLPNQSRSAKPAGIVPLSPSLAHFRTPTATRSNLHSARQPSYPTSRAFLHWRLSDDGPVRAAPPSWGRHPKPFTKGDIARREALLSPLEHVHGETIGVNLAIHVGPKAIHLIALDIFDGHQ